MPLYEAALQEKPQLLAKSRLAYCYRMLNQTEKAEALYAEVVANEKARSETYLFYADALMSNSKYAEAKDWFLRYFALEPEDSMALRRAAACDWVPLIQPYFPALQIEAFAHNSEADDNMPAFWRGGLVFTSDRPSGKALLKEKSGWTGRDYTKLYFSRFDPSTNTFRSPRSFSGRLNELNKNTANASFTGDGEAVFFSRNGNDSNRKSEFTLQLYTAEHSGGRWRNERKLEFCRTELNYMHPSVSPDGNTLFFAANSGGEGGFDIFMARRHKNGEWGHARALGPTVNTPAHEAFPYFHHDGRLFFCSKGHAGYGGFDVFVTRMDSATGQWAAPLNLGKPINSSLDDIGFFLAPNDSVGCFTSGRNGGDDDLWLFYLGQNPNWAHVFFPEGVEIPDNEEDIEMVEPVSKDSSGAETALVNPSVQNAVSEKKLKTEALLTLPELDSVLQKGILQKGTLVQLPGLRYDSLQALQLSTQSGPDLDSLAALLLRFPLLEIEIGCHTESTGPGKENLAISKARAENLARLLAEKGIPPARIRAKGYGEKKLLNDCDDDADCPPEKQLENRRVEIKLMN